MLIVEIELALARLNSSLQAQGEPKINRSELASRIGIAAENLSKLNNGHFTAIKRSTLDALCRELACQPGDLLRYVPIKSSSSEEG